MSSNNLSLENYDLNEIVPEDLIDKETQTSFTYITDSFYLVKGPSRPLPKGIGKSDVESTNNNILDCSVIKKPSDSKSTELKSESFVADIVDSNLCNNIDQASEHSASPYNCKESAKPSLKTHLKDCEDYVQTLEEFIQDALEDFPDYQPCFEVYVEKNLNQEKVNETSNSKMSTSRNKSNLSKETIVKNISNTNTIPGKADDQSTQSTSIDKMKLDSYANVHLPKDDTIDLDEIGKITKSTSLESISRFIKNCFLTSKQSTSSCLDKKEIVIGIKRPKNPGEKPIYYAMEKPQVGKSSHNVQTEIGASLKSLQNLFHKSTDKVATFTDACKSFAGNLLTHPDEKMQAIKESCKNYAGKVYTNSKNAITSLTSESAKLLSKSNSTDNLKESPSNQKARSISVHSFTNFIFRKAENKPLNDVPSEEKMITGSSKTTDAILPAVKVSYNKIKDDIVSSTLDKSSPYDTVLPKDEESKSSEIAIPTVSAIDHPPVPPSSSNVFEIIKSKIFSIFGNESAVPTEHPQTQDDNEDEYPYEKYMEQ